MQGGRRICFLVGKVYLKGQRRRRRGPASLKGLSFFVAGSRLAYEFKIREGEDLTGLSARGIIIGVKREWLRITGECQGSLPGEHFWKEMKLVYELKNGREQTKVIRKSVRQKGLRKRDQGKEAKEKKGRRK